MYIKSFFIAFFLFQTNTAVFLNFLAHCALGRQPTYSHTLFESLKAKAAFLAGLSAQLGLAETS